MHHPLREENGLRIFVNELGTCVFATTLAFVIHTQDYFCDALLWHNITNTLIKFYCCCRYLSSDLGYLVILQQLYAEDKNADLLKTRMYAFHQYLC